MPRWLPERPSGRVIVVGAGKAAGSMAKVLESEWSGPLQGKVIVPYGHTAGCRTIEEIEASHPLPDAAGVAAARSILDAVSNLSPDDTVVALISGGGSSLMCVPADGVSLAEKQSISRQLLRCGAAIHEINCVRKKLSAIKGGKLAVACAPASVMTLLISDIPGNQAAMIASGPTVSDEAAPAEALDILARYGIEIFAAVRQVINNSTPVRVAEGDVRILANSDDALLAAAAVANDNDITPYSLGDLSGDARLLGQSHADLALQIAAGEGPVETPCVILSGGETTVSVRGDGRGGRNGEYALSLAVALQSHPNVYAIAADTDGIDGSGTNAGCFVMPDSLQRGMTASVDALELLNNNDSLRFFDATDDLLVTGPTRTNVNDFRAIFIAR